MAFDNETQDSPIASVRELVRPFDPLTTRAEDDYDAVVRRLNRTRRDHENLRIEYDHLTRQFVEDDLVVQTGTRRGQPLSAAGRKRRLDRLIEVATKITELKAEDAFASRALDRMNEALDRWARETYAP